MKKYLLILLFPMLLASCLDHDNPELGAINTEAVKIDATIAVTPSNTWLDRSQELVVRVSDVKMTAPKGVILRNIRLMVDDCQLLTKPYSGDELEYRVPLNYITPGRLNFAVWGDLVQKDHRDASIIIVDNISKILFEEMPELECEASVAVTVHGTSTAGEVYDKSFTVMSDDAHDLPVPASELYWTPSAGTASYLDVTLAASATTSSPNSSLSSVAQRVYWGAAHGTEPTIKLHIANKPGSLDAEKLVLLVSGVWYGKWENISIEDAKMNFPFTLKEVE